MASKQKRAADARMLTKVVENVLDDSVLRPLYDHLMKLQHQHESFAPALRKIVDTARFDKSLTANEYTKVLGIAGQAQAISMHIHEAMQLIILTEGERKERLAEKRKGN